LAKQIVHNAERGSDFPEECRQRCLEGFQEVANLLFFLELMTSIGSQDRGETGFQFQSLGFSGGGVGNILPEENELRALRDGKQSTAKFQQITFRN